MSELMCVLRIRVSGIRGLQGVVRKTVDDELQVNIWEPRHMEQIVPALLVNLEPDTDSGRCAHEFIVTLFHEDTVIFEGSWFRKASICLKAR